MTGLEFLKDARNRHAVENLLSSALRERSLVNFRYVCVIFSQPMPMVVTNFTTKCAAATYVQQRIDSDKHREQGYTTICPQLGVVITSVQDVVRRMVKSYLPVFMCVNVDGSTHELSFDAHTVEYDDSAAFLPVIQTMCDLWHEEHVFDEHMRE